MKKIILTLILAASLSSCALRSPIAINQGTKDTLDTSALNTLSLIVFGRPLEDIPKDRVEAWLVRFGKTFGPKGLRHFSELNDAEKEQWYTKVPVLRTTHTDWPKPLRWIPRTYTVWIGPAPTRDLVIEGNISEGTLGDNGILKPIPACGDYYIFEGFMTSTSPLYPGSATCIHNRVGWRFDDVDGYWTLTFTIKTFE